MTLEEYYEARATELSAKVNAATGEFTTSQQTVASHQADLDTAVDDYETALRAIDAARVRAGAAGASPAEIDAAEQEVRTQTAASRALAAVVLSRRQELATAKADRARAEGRLTRWITEQQRAEREWTTYEARVAQQILWIEQLGEEPISTLATNATTVLAGASTPAGETPESAAQIFQAARERIDADLPAVLRTRAMERVIATLDHVDIDVETDTGAVAVLRAETDAALGPETVASVATATYDAAEHALRSHVMYATSTYAEAVTRLHAVLALTPLSGEDRAKITDTALVDAGSVALPYEKVRDVARLAIAREESAYAVAVIAQAADDVDAAPPSEPASLTDARAAYTAAQAAYDEIQEDDGVRDDLNAWELVVPDHAWTALTTFAVAQRELERIRDTDVDALKQDLVDAESELVEALKAAAKARRTRATITEEASRIEAISAARLAQSDDQIFSVARGDHE